MDVVFPFAVAVETIVEEMAVLLVVVFAFPRFVDIVAEGTA